MLKVAIVAFPGSNCERDVQTVLSRVYKFQPELVWHTRPRLGNYDAVVLPGGFSYGDRLRAGAIAAKSPVMKEVKRLELSMVKTMERKIPILTLLNNGYL